MNGISLKRLLILLVLTLSACGAFPATSPARITIEWTTATEINTAGFNLYRGESAAGPFTKINAQMIPASPDPVTGGKYKFEDPNTTPGQTYYYQLEDVEYNGTASKHPPLAVTAAASWDGVWMLLVMTMIGLLVLLGVWIIRRRVRRVF